MAFKYNYLEDVDSPQNSIIIEKFNKILEKNNNNVLKQKIDTINSEFKEDKTSYDEVHHKIRWNTYYYKKYQQQTKIVVVIIFVCILMIILSKLRSPYFDEKAYSLMMGLLLGIAFIYIFYELWDLLLKDNQNFDEYDYSIYGKGHKDIKDLTPIDSVDISNCVQKHLTPESINSSFLNKYF